jgi:O-antigen/teichoic acid export membrane protein
MGANLTLARRAFSGTVAGIASLVAQLVLQFVSVPVLLRNWGDETYGVWLATNSLYALLVTFDLGHQNFVGAQLLGTVGVNDGEARTVVQTGVAGATLLAVLEVLVAGGLHLAGVLDEAAVAPPNRAQEVALAVAILLLAWVAVGSVGGVLVRLYAPRGEFARATWIGLGQRTTMACAALVAAACGGGIVHAAFATSLASVSWALAVFVDLRRFREYRPFYGRGVDRARLFRNLGGSFVLTSTAFVMQAQQHVLLMILGGTAVGATAIAMFATTRTVANLFLQGAATFVAPLAPDLVRAHVEAQRERVATLLVVLGGVGASVSIVGVALLFPVVTTLYMAWTGRALAFDRTLFALLAAAVISRAAASPMLTLLSGTNSLRAQFVGASTQTVVTLAVAAVLAPLDGLRGVCAGALLGELIVDVVVYPRYVRTLQPHFLSAAPRGTGVILGSLGAALALLVTGAYSSAPDLLVAPLLALTGVVVGLATFRALPDAGERARALLRRRFL